MTVVLTGGGSGGHITPILAVAAELKKLNRNTQVVYIGQKGDGLVDLPSKDPNIDKVYFVRAGKFRRYSGEGWHQLLDLKTQALNFRDIFMIVGGVAESYRLIRQIKPAVIFTRGGYVSVPVAFGGLLNKVPYLTHDSDSVPSLSNKIISRWADLHAVALPAEVYPYPAKKIKEVGIPLSGNYQLVTARLKRHYRKLLHVDKADQVLLVTGGGNGAEKLNSQVLNNAEFLLGKFPDMVILHIAGRKLEKKLKADYEERLPKDSSERVIVKGFVTDLYRYSGAADLVIARGSATSLAELALQAKPCLLVPSPQLIWNQKNAAAMEKHQAVVVLSDEQADQELRLGSAVADLLKDNTKLQHLSKQIYKQAHPGSAQEVAKILIKYETSK